MKNPPQFEWQSKTAGTSTSCYRQPLPDSVLSFSFFHFFSVVVLSRPDINTLAQDVEEHLFSSYTARSGKDDEVVKHETLFFVLLLLLLLPILKSKKPARNDVGSFQFFVCGHLECQRLSIAFFAAN